MNRIEWIALASLALMTTAQAASTEKTAGAEIKLVPSGIPLSSEVPKGWLAFDSRALNLDWQKLSWKTDDWEDFFQTDTSYPAYSFAYPASWKFNGSSVFNIAYADKIAELMPGVVRLKSGQQCFDNIKPEKGLKFSKRSIHFGRFQGSKVISELVVDGASGGTYQGYRYCLSENQFAFSISFFTDKPNPKSEQIFDEVISTFKFLEPTNEQHNEIKGTQN